MAAGRQLGSTTTNVELPRRGRPAASAEAIGSTTSPREPRWTAVGSVVECGEDVVELEARRRCALELEPVGRDALGVELCDRYRRRRVGRDCPAQVDSVGDQRGPKALACGIGGQPAEEGDVHPEAGDRPGCVEGPAAGHLDGPPVRPDDAVDERLTSDDDHATMMPSADRPNPDDLGDTRLTTRPSACTPRLNGRRNRLRPPSTSHSGVRPCTG